MAVVQMDIDGTDALDKLLRLPGIGSAKFVLSRSGDVISIKTVERFLSYVKYDNEIHVYMYNGANLYVDIDTKTPVDYKRAIRACGDLYKNIRKHTHKATNLYPILIGSYPTSLHFHINGVWFNDISAIPKYLNRYRFRFYDGKVYKRNSSLRIGLCAKIDDPHKKYGIVDAYGFKYSERSITKIMVPSIPPKGLGERHINKYTYLKSSANSTYTVGKNIDVSSITTMLADRYNITISRYKLAPGGVYITPQKPWFCPICNRSHSSNNFMVSNKGVIVCFSNRVS